MQFQPISTAAKIRSFPWYYGAQASNVVFILLTWFGPVLPLFLNALGMSKSQIGLILAIPFFCSLLSLLVSGWVLRRGLKRVFLWGYGLRMAITAGLLAAPLILGKYGVGATVLWVAVVSLGFSVCRAIGETGFIAWSREFIPNPLRGKTDAMNAIVCGVVSLATSLLASVALAAITGITGYRLLVLVSLPFGLVSVLAFAMVPGGQPAAVEPERPGYWASFRAVLHDRNFWRFQAGLACYNMGILGLSFMPLYIQDQIGLGADRVLLLSACYWVGVLASSYLWGWSGDRFGSKPVLLTGLLLACLLPLFFFLMPRGGAWSLRWAIATYVYYGIANQGVGAGAGRYVFVGAIPPQTRNPAYVAIHYAWGGLFCGLGPLWAGRVLDASRGLRWEWGVLHVDEFTPLFAVVVLLLLAVFVALRRLRKDGAVQPREFMSMFVQGNPIMAFHSMIRYRFADNETERVSTTRRLGDAENPLSAAELLEAVTDPSFNVRYEAILAMARMPAQPGLTEALGAILDSKEPDLCVAAGWALGRIGDRRAIPALRRALRSEYALLRSRSARSLAILGDADAVPLLLDLLHTEPHDGIRVAYATALGQFRADQAMADLLALLDRLPPGTLRREVCLALARLIGGERHFIRLWRATRQDFGTGCANAVLALERRYERLRPPLPDCTAALAEAERAFAEQDSSRAAAVLAGLVGRLSPGALEDGLQRLLAGGAARLAGAGSPDPDLVLLVLSGLQAAAARLWREGKR